MKKQTQWIPTAFQMPPPMHRVLVVLRGLVFVAQWWGSSGMWIIEGNAHHADMVSTNMIAEWMPLPDVKREAKP